MLFWGLPTSWIFPTLGAAIGNAYKSPAVSFIHEKKTAMEAVPINPADEESEAWEECKRNGFNFGTGGAAGNPLAGKWARALKRSQVLKDRYAAVKGFGTEAKAAFRAEWAQETYKAYAEKRVATSFESTAWIKDRGPITRLLLFLVT